MASWTGDAFDVDCLRPAAGFEQFIGDEVSFLQGPVALHAYRGVMDEYIPSVFPGYESPPLLIAEEFYFTSLSLALIAVSGA